MPRVLHWMLVVFAMTAIMAVTTAAGASEVPVVNLVPGTSIESLRDEVRFRPIDPDRPVVAPDLTGTKAVEYSSTQFGRVGSSVEGALMFRNDGTRPGSWILTTGRGLLEQFVLWRQVPGSQPELIFDNRNSEQLGAVLREYQSISLPIELAPGERVTYLFRLSDNISMWLPFRVMDPTNFFFERRANIAMVAGIIGGSLMLLLINSLVFAITGRREFLWLAAAEAAFAFNTLYAEGYTTIFLLYRWPLFAELFGEFSRSLFGILMMQFGRSFLATRIAQPRLDLALRGLIWLGIAVMGLATLHLVAGFLPILLVHQIGWIYLLVTVLAMMMLGVLALRRGSIFLPLSIAWASMAIYIAYMTVAVSGAMPSLPVLWHWIGPIGLFECMMASITLVLHLRVLQTERLASERHARSALLEKLALTEEAARLADERTRALADLRARDRTIEESAHDTRHVLHALNSAVHFGRRGDGGSSPDFIALLEASARHLEDIIASTVSSSNGDGRFLALTVTDLSSLLDGLAEIYAPIAERGELSLKVGPARIKHALVDEALLSRVVSNLINNALKFTQTGGVEVSCFSEDDLLRLVVSDTGTGMAPDLLDWLNDHAGDTAAPEPSLGLGTGWRAIRDIAALLHGSYTIESSDKGTQVTVILPNPVQRGTTPVDQAQLAAACRRFEFVDLAQGGCSKPGDGRPVVVLADYSTAQTRAESAACSQLLLVRPLCREMLDHPYVAELARTPAARAMSTT